MPAPCCGACRRWMLLSITLLLLPCHGWAGRMMDVGAAGRSRGDAWSLKKLASRRFVLEEQKPAPARGTCRLSWYTSPPPQFGNTILCNGSSTDSCFQPCMAGYEQLHNSSLCLQKCPDKAAGPAHLCPISRTCIRSEGACPVLSDVPFFCTVPDQFMGGCAKQSYQAVPATHQLEPPCSGTAYRDHTGGWRCTEGQQQQAPCSPGFANMSAVVLGVGARCTQVCPPWLVDCGEACHMPGVPCIQSPEHLCPIAPLAACNLSERSASALAAACQSEGFHGTGGCPLTLRLHGSCGGSRLQVAAGLRSAGFLRKLEAWWGPVVGAEPLPDNYDGPLRAVRLTFAHKKQTVVFGNASLALASSPRMTFSLDPNELVVGADMWSSSSVMDGSALTPLLAGFTLYTSDRNAWSAGGTTNWEGQLGNARVGAALSSWEQHVSVAGRELGVGLPVGAAAYSSDAGVHAFGLIFLSRTLKQEL